MLILLGLTLAAHASDEQRLVWNVALDGKTIGQRTMTVKHLGEGDAARRVLEVWTELDATVLGVDYTFRERLTAHVGDGAAAFHAVMDLSGDVTEVQARRGSTAWTVTVNLNGRESTREFPATSIDLSTADLLDPDTRVPLSRFDAPKVLTAESGDVWAGTIERLGPSDIVVAGESIPVDGFAWTPSGSPRMRLFYTADGFLVRYEADVMGRKLVGTLEQPPPSDIDASPLDAVGAGIQEIEL